MNLAAVAPGKQVENYGGGSSVLLCPKKGRHKGMGTMWVNRETEPFSMGSC